MAGSNDEKKTQPELHSANVLTPEKHNGTEDNETAAAATATIDAKTRIDETEDNKSAKLHQEK